MYLPGASIQASENIIPEFPKTISKKMVLKVLQIGQELSRIGRDLSRIGRDPLKTGLKDYQNMFRNQVRWKYIVIRTNLAIPYI